MKFPSLQNKGLIGLDIETYDPDLETKGPGVRRDGYIVGVSIATESGFSGYFPVAHHRGKNLPKKEVMHWLREELRTPQPKVGANILYDMDFLEAEGVIVGGPHYDVQNAEPLIYENRYTFSLESLAQRYLKQGKVRNKMVEWIVENLGVKEGDAMSHIWETPSEIVAPYAIGDAVLPIKILQKQLVKLKQLGLMELFQLETDIVPMLLAMRQRGVRIDVAKAKALRLDLAKQQKKIISEIKYDTGVELQPWAASSIQKIFDHEGLDYPLTPKTKKPSFKKDWLAHQEHPVAKKINEVRHLDKLGGAFLDNSLINGHIRNRIHCQFNQLKSDEGGTVTGRFSCSLPNLQQIPVRTKVGKLIRSCFIPDHAGQLWGKIDYSQIEYRLLANEAVELDLPGAAEVLAAYQSDEADFHQIVAEMTGLSRDAAKTINFGIAYGEGVKKLCAALGLSKSAGYKLLDNYHERAPFMRPLMETCMNEAQSTGIVRTLYGRYRHFDMWEKVVKGEYHLFPRRQHGSRRSFTYAALNARTQGTAADIFKMAMRKIWHSGIIAELGVPQLIVHDEIDVSVPDTKRGRAAFAEMKHLMETVVQLHIPLKADASMGPNWGSLK